MELTQSEKDTIIEVLTKIQTTGEVWESTLKPIVLKLQTRSKNTKDA